MPNANSRARTSSGALARRGGSPGRRTAPLIAFIDLYAYLPFQKHRSMQARGPHRDTHRAPAGGGGREVSATAHAPAFRRHGNRAPRGNSSFPNSPFQSSRTPRQRCSASYIRAFFFFPFSSRTFFLLFFPGLSELGSQTPSRARVMASAQGEAAIEEDDAQC